MRIRAVLVCLLAGCSGGDLLLPESPEPVTLRILSGDGQQADAGTVLDQPLVVQVLDRAADPIPGASVRFDFLGDVPGAGIDPPLVTTGEDGTAHAFVRLGTTGGTQMILARVAGTASPDLSARFRVVAVASRGDGKGNGKGKGGGHDDDDD